MSFNKTVTLLCYLIIGIVGLLTNLFGLFKITTLKEFRHCFGYICICQLISNCLTLSIFLFWSCPCLIIFKDEVDLETINRIMGCFGILAWNLTMYSHIAASINRFVAMYIPTKYSRIFTNKTCIMIITAIWVLSFCHVIPYIFLDCIYKFSVQSLTWIFIFTTCTKILTSIDLYLSLSNICFSFFLDFLIFIKLGIQGKKSNGLRRTIAPSNIQSYNNTTSTKKPNGPNKKTRTKSVYNNRIRFFFQSFMQNILIGIELVCFHIICYNVEGKLLSMLFSSGAWALCHTIDGFILCVFNKEIRNSFFKIFGCKK
uniref:G_PROTEIN_RECEP_F1_2 domain-containing protein n=1 Tax=Strongyloides stercoralis TaxID=6248 RepID=A0A0K0EJE8_STRER